MSPQKKVVEKITHCFERQDWAGWLSCFTDDAVRCEVGSPEVVRGKKELDRHIRPGPAVEKMRAQIHRMTEEGNVVVAEGAVQVDLKDGKTVHVQVCNVFEFEGEKVKRQTAFAIDVPPPG